MKKPKTIIVLLLAILVVIVLLQNLKAVDVQFLFWEFSASAFIMYLIFYVVGAVSAILGMFWRKI